MQENMEFNHGNVDAALRANAVRKLRMKRKAVVVHRTIGRSRQRSTRIPIPPTPPARVVNPSTLNFLFEKRLKFSDVKDEGRIVVPKSYAEEFMPVLEAKEGFFIFMDDITEAKVWRFRYRFWPNNATRVYVLEKTSEFVRGHELKVGDFLMIYKDNETGRFAVGVRKGAGEADAADDLNHLPTNNSGTVADVPLAEMQTQGGSSSSTSTAADSQSVPEVAMSGASYGDALQDFPMHLLDRDMDTSTDLPDF